MKVEIEETPTNIVLLSGYRAYEKVLPASCLIGSDKERIPAWWQQPDTSINNLFPKAVSP